MFLLSVSIWRGYGLDFFFFWIPRVYIYIYIFFTTDHVHVAIKQNILPGGAVGKIFISIKTIM